MASTLEITLDWQGPFHSAEKVPKQAGVYLILAGIKNDRGKWEPDSYIILDIGQSGRAGNRLSNHDRESSWEANTPHNFKRVIKYALMPTDDYTEDDRRTVECCLRSYHAPLPCGSECNTGFNKERHVVVNNTGKHSPLLPGYSCI